MDFPLKINFKVWAIVPQIFVSDQQGNPLLYIKQKLFKLKEEVNVFLDQNQQNLLYKIKADRIIDFSARYSVTDPSGIPICSIKRNGMKSLWRANYDIMTAETPVYKIQEENPWVMIFDSLLREVPILSLFSGFLFHPVYLIRQGNEQGEVIAKIKKKSAFFESKFEIEKIDQNLDEESSKKILLSSIMLFLLERTRG